MTRGASVQLGALSRTGSQKFVFARRQNQQARRACSRNRIAADTAAATGVAFRLAAAATDAERRPGFHTEPPRRLASMLFGRRSVGEFPRRWRGQFFQWGS